MGSMIWSAVLVHLKGLALSFQNLIHCSSALVSSSMEQKTPRSRRRRCSSANHRSTWFSHEEYAGVKCSAKRGCSMERLVEGCFELPAFSTLYKMASRIRPLTRMGAES